MFTDPHQAGTGTGGASAIASINSLNDPQGVYVSPVTGEIWVANTGGSNSLRYANLQSVQLGLGPINGNGISEASGIFAFHPLATVQDQYGDLFVADDAHRVAIYYPSVNICNGASFLPASPTTSQDPSATCLSQYTLAGPLPVRGLAPGAWGTIKPCSSCGASQFLTNQNVAGIPFPIDLGDVQVFIDGTPAPLYIVYPGQINFIVPNSARTSGFADLQVVQKSTGQVLGSAQVPMNSVAPAAFACPSETGLTVYACAINQDGTVNSASNPAQRGQYISLYMTGQGMIPGAPPDGVPATTGIPSQYNLTVLLNGIDVNDPSYQEQNTQHILYSGINGIPGDWQINLLIPKTVVPSSGAVWFAAILNSVPNWDVTSPFRTYIYVK